MTYLTYAAGGSQFLGLSRTICVPIVMCEDETTALQLEQHLISTVHPALNDLYAALCAPAAPAQPDMDGEAARG